VKSRPPVRAPERGMPDLIAELDLPARSQRCANETAL
jgi:hypothetical protein